MNKCERLIVELIDGSIDCVVDGDDRAVDKALERRRFAFEFFVELFGGRNLLPLARNAFSGLKTCNARL